MMKSPPRVVFTVAQHAGGWAVERDGEHTDLSASREEAMASASRRARAASAEGLLTQVVIQGEPGYFGIVR